MKKLFTNREGKALALVGLAVASVSPAMAAIDTADVLTAITAAVAAVGIVGVAILGVKVAVASFKWVKAAIS